jgi:PAS domain S-box-containing protein
MQNFEVCGEAQDGGEAIAKAFELQPDAVVMDVSMPGMNGIQALEEIRRILPKTQVVVLSQYDSPRLVAEAMSAGAATYVTKSSIWPKLVPALKKVQLGEAFMPEFGPCGGQRTNPDVQQRIAELEERLFDSEERFRATFEQTAVGIGFLDENGDWLRVNQKFCDIVGYSKAEFETLRLNDITHPVDLAVDLVQVKKIADGELDRYSMQKRYIRKDGQVVAVRVNVDAVRDHEGNLKYCVRVAQDGDAPQSVKAVQAKLAKAERDLQIASGHLELVANRIAAPLSQCSRDMRYVWVNSHYARWLERPVEKIAGRRIVDVIGKDAFQTLRRRFEEVLTGSYVAYEAAVTFERIGLRHIAAAYKPTYDSSGAVDGWVALEEDTTDRMGKNSLQDTEAK